MTYRPDYWLVLNTGDGCRLLVDFIGAYADADRWRLNSGITRVEDLGDFLAFFGESGSRYLCKWDPAFYRVGRASGPTLDLPKMFYKEVTVLPYETDWLNFNWRSNFK